jgi:membrane dipeptidase
MLIIDAHLDLSWNAVQWNRDLLLAAHTIRTLETGIAGKGRGLGTVALPDMRRGRVALSVATILARSTGRPVPHVDFHSTAQSQGVARGQLAYYRALEKQGHASVIGDRAALDSHWAAWEAWEQTPEGTAPPPLGFVISMEGADPILAPDELEEWCQLGLRLIGITHYGPGRYAGGTGTELGLTDIGGALLAEMERLGVVLDLTHCSDQAFWQAVERFSGPVIASHNNCRTLVKHQRQFDDDQLRAIIERDGVIGAALDTWMVVPGWVASERPNPANPPATLNDVVNHIDHVCQLAGNSHHAAIGSDLDGGFGLEQSPSDLDTIADLQSISGLLVQRGYAEADIAAIMHGNWLRVLRKAWK